jgi:hypothetical protein
MTKPPALNEIRNMAVFSKREVAVYEQLNIRLLLLSAQFNFHHRFIGLKTF